jgi:hypothetical protein
MRFMVIVKATNESETNSVPADVMNEMFTAMQKYNEELVRAGVMLAGEGLLPSNAGKRVRFAGPKRTVIDGPFTEVKELVAGFWIFQCKSMEECVEWVKRCPNPMPIESEIEIRPIAEMTDFPDASPEVIAKENELRERLEKK